MKSILREHALYAMLQWGTIEKQILAGNHPYQDDLTLHGGISGFREHTLDQNSTPVDDPIEDTVPFEQANTAMMAWSDINYTYLSSSANNPYRDAAKHLGNTQMLLGSVLDDLAPAIEAGYRSVEDRFDEPFDLDFVPMFLAEATSHFNRPVTSLRLSEESAVEISEGMVLEVEYDQCAP